MALGVLWYDESDYAVNQDPRERVTIVPRGAWAKLGHNQWRMLGRLPVRGGSAGGSASSSAPPGGAQLVLLLEAKVLDVEGGKELDKMEYEVRDREGHVWSADGIVENQSIDAARPTPGSTPRVKVTAVVPQRKLSSVVLDVHINAVDRAVLDVLRFAH